jgi:transcriptional regulator with XRE-family HTH domain
MKYSIPKNIIRSRMKSKGMRPEDLASQAKISFATARKAADGQVISATVYYAILLALDLPENGALGNAQLTVPQHSARSNGGSR